MKKLINKDKKIRYYYFNYYEKKNIILKLIFKNFNFSVLLRWNAIFLICPAEKNSKTVLLNQCLFSFNKKRFNILSVFSRHIFLKLIKKGSVPNIIKN